MAVLGINEIPGDVFNSLNVMQQARLRGGGMIPINLSYYDAIRAGGGLDNLQPVLLGAGPVPRGNLPQTIAETPTPVSQPGANPAAPSPVTDFLPSIGGPLVSRDIVNSIPETYLGGRPTVGGAKPTASVMNFGGGIGDETNPFQPGMDVTQPARISHISPRKSGNVKASPLANAMLQGLGV